MKHEESAEQQAFVAWCRMSKAPYNLIFAIENEGRKTPQAGARAKSMGKLAGVSDLILLYPTFKYHGLCIEMKAKGGKQSTCQGIFQHNVEKYGYLYVLCYSADEAIKTIKKYVEEKQ